MTRNLRLSTALASGIVLLAGCQAAPKIVPSAPPLPPVVHQSPPPPPEPPKAEGFSTMDALGTGLALVPALTLAAGKGARLAKPPVQKPPPAPSPEPDEPYPLRPSNLAGAADETAAEKSGLAGLWEKLRGSSTLRAAAGAGAEGGEVAAVEGGVAAAEAGSLGGLTLLRMFAPPVVAAALLYELMKK